MSWKTVACLVTFVLVGLGVNLPGMLRGADSPYVIKFSCVAPERSMYVRQARIWDQKLRALTRETAQLRIYPGGILGDELDIIKKMRAGQIHATGVTGIGMGEMLPASRVLELPRLFRSYAEQDAVKARLEDFFRAQFLERGFVLVGFTGVGPVHIFSRQPIRNVKDLSRSRIWAWESDPVSMRLLKEFRVPAVSLNLLDVLPSLQTGVIDGVYGSPLAMVTMQWHEYLKYMTAEPLGFAEGVIAIERRAFEALPPDVRAKVLELGKETTREISRLSRLDNERAKEAMIGRGMQVVSVEAADLAQLDTGARGVWAAFAGSLYSPELLESVQATLASVRATGVNR